MKFSYLLLLCALFTSSLLLAGSYNDGMLWDFYKNSLTSSIVLYIFLVSFIIIYIILPKKILCKIRFLPVIITTYTMSVYFYHNYELIKQIILHNTPIPIDIVGGMTAQSLMYLFACGLFLWVASKKID